MPTRGYEDLRSHSPVAEEAALHLNEDPQVRKERLLARDRSEGEREVHKRYVARPAGRYALIGASEYASA